MYHAHFRGTHYEAGFRWGSLLLKHKNIILENIPFEITQERIDYALSCLPIYEKYYHEIVEEIQGLADGQQCDVRILQAVLFSMYSMPPSCNCSCFAFTTEQEILLGRNSDFLTEIERLNQNVVYKLTDGVYSFTGNTTAFIEIEDGVNEHGLAVGLTSVYPNQCKPGFNAGMIVRYLLEKCRNVSEAVSCLYQLPIASAQTLTLADTMGAIAVIECNAEQIKIEKTLNSNIAFVCATNTFHLPGMVGYNNDNPLSLKADFILSLCELVVGGKEGLLPVEKTVIDRCVHLIYRKYFANPCPENMPILEDLYNALLQQDEKEAHHVATALEIYVKGSLNLFNHRTNVNVNNRIVCYDIKELGKQMKKLGMLIVQDQVWGRVTANRSSGKSTRYYMDEMHLLLKEEQTAAYSVEIWKRFRKWGGIPTGLTQNVKDLLSSREVENIFENSDMIIMLNQAAGDRQILAKQLNISPHQLSYVTHSGEGEGLLFFGNVILPFVDRFPTDLELYRIMTTKLGEVSEGAQK